MFFLSCSQNYISKNLINAKYTKRILTMNKSLEFNKNNLIKIDLSSYGIEDAQFYIYLDFLNHDKLSGNKLRKLYGSIQHMKYNNLNTLITVGGNYSNYLFAASYLKELENINCIFLIKGHEPKNYGFTLSKMKENRARLLFYMKEDLKNNLMKIRSELISLYPNSFFVPEGGENEFAHIGFESLVKNNFDQFDHICIPIGTSSTYLSTKKYVHSNTHVVGYAAHNDFSIGEDIIYNYSFGGFAKMNDQLFEFILNFKEKFNILLDPIYTSKMIYGIIEDYKIGKYTSDNKILAIHTGGLQGWKGILERFPKYKNFFV